MSLAIDPWAESPLGPPDAPEELSPERVKHLHADIYAYGSDDRTAVPQLLKMALRYVEECALAGHPGAAETLDVMATRSTSGIEFGEPQEPAWSLDPDIRLPRRGE